MDVIGGLVLPEDEVNRVHVGFVEQWHRGDRCSQSFLGSEQEFDEPHAEIAFVGRRFRYTQRFAIRYLSPGRSVT